MSEALAHLIYTNISITIMIKHTECKLKVFLINEFCLVWSSIHELRVADFTVAVLVYSTENRLPIMSLSFFTVLSYAIVDLRRKLPHLLPTNVTIVVRIHRLEMFS